MTKLNPKVRFIEPRNNRYIYEIDGVEVDLKENLAECEVIQRIYLISNSLKNKDDFRQGNIGMPLRDFILLGYLFLKEDMSEYFVHYIMKLILNCNKKKLTGVLILKYIFNASMGEIQYTIHSSTDKSRQKYNDRLMEFVCDQIYEGKRNLVRKLLDNKDIATISKIVRLITLNSFLQICAGDHINGALEYFEFVINEKLLPDNIQLGLNSVIASGTGLTQKEVKGIKNIYKSEEKENFYNQIKNLMNKYKKNFYLFKEEAKCIKSIEKALENFNTLNEGELAKLRPNRVLRICMELFKEKFELYLEHISNEQANRNIIINRQNIIMEMFSNVDDTKANHIYTYYKMNDTNTMLEDFVKAKFKSQVKKQDEQKININDDRWVLHWRIKEKLKKNTINLTELKSSVLKNEIKQYYKYIIDREYRYKSENEGISEIITATNLVIKSIKYLQENFKVSSASDIRLIHVRKLVKYLQNDYKTKGNKNIKVSTIIKGITHLKNFIDWLTETDIKNISKPLINPFQYVVFKGVNNENTEIIPECVIEKILVHLNELGEDIQRMVLIMLNCGMRFKEVAYLEEDCTSESNNEYKVLKYIPYKVLEARRRNGLDDYHRIVIDDELYEEIEEQKDYSHELREKYNAREIFLTTGVNDNLCMIDSASFCNAVQKLINKYKIVDEKGQLWKITSKQYRKTLAVDMITNGKANEHEVGNFLGHMNVGTTKKFYAEVRKMNMAEMNSDYFKKKFQLAIEKKHLEGFTEEERKRLYVDFCLNAREVEYGVCTRAFGVESCNRRGDIFGCATCSKICTGKKYYKRWKGLYENQKNRVDILIEKYQSSGVRLDEYIKFREFEREKYLLDSFKVVIDKLEGEYGCGN